MLFGTKGFMKALDKLKAAKDLTEDQCAERLYKAIEKVCHANLLGGAGLAVTGILAGIGFKELRNRHRQRKNGELKSTNKEEI